MLVMLFSEIQSELLMYTKNGFRWWVQYFLLTVKVLRAHDYMLNSIEYPIYNNSYNSGLLQKLSANC